MPAGSEKIQIINAALLKIGAETIDSLEDGTAESDVAASLYQLVVDGELSLYPWKFATQEYELGVALPDAPAGGVWERQHQLPSNVGWIRKVELNGNRIEYQRFEDKLYTNLAAADLPIMQATFRVAEEMWPPFFKLFIMQRLAEWFAGPITEQTGKVAEMRAAAEDLYIRAKHADGTQASQATRRMPMGMFAGARR